MFINFILRASSGLKVDGSKKSMIEAFSEEDHPKAVMGMVCSGYIVSVVNGACVALDGAAGQPEARN